MNWMSLESLFQELNRSCDWLVLRYSGESILAIEDGDDIDVLCSDLACFVKESGAKKRGQGVSAYKVKVNNEWVPFDIRYIGDGYMDAAWQTEMLKTKIKHGIVYVPNEVNYYYSLIYHALIHKGFYKESYIDQLQAIENCKSLTLKSKITGSVIDDVSGLNVWMKSKDYIVSLPNDVGCYGELNFPILKKFWRVQNKNLFSLIRVNFSLYLFKVSPVWLRRMIPKNIKSALLLWKS